MTFDFCTYFDHRYLTEGLCLYRSLEQHCSSFRLWVLCLDERCYKALKHLNLPHVNLISLLEFEVAAPELLIAKSNRTLVEYYFTCTPALPLYILGYDSQVEVITYLDADLYFFADPSPLYEELGNNSVAIIAHRFSDKLRERESAGLYNVGWLSFRRDVHALECLQWWHERCIEWCYHREEDGRYADQKYLDDWPTRFIGVKVLQHKGANLAPWNVANYQIGCAQGNVRVDEQELLFYHFHGLKQEAGWLYNLYLEEYGVDCANEIVKCIYAPYMKELSWAKSTVARLHGINDTECRTPSVNHATNLEIRQPGWKSWLRSKRDFLRGFKRRTRIIVVNGRILFL